MSKMSSLTSFSRAKSDASTSSIESDSFSSSSQMSAFDSDPDDGKNAVTSIVALGNGHFLTASKCDRVSSIVWLLALVCSIHVPDLSSIHQGNQNVGTNK